jgi:hypothetical protein
MLNTFGGSSHLKRTQRTFPCLAFSVRMLKTLFITSVPLLNNDRLQLLNECFYGNVEAC